MTQQIADFEENDLTDFDSTVTSGTGTIAASATAAMEGSYGALVTVSAAGDAAYGRLDGPSGETLVNAELLFDPNSITMADADLFTIGLLRRDVDNQQQAFLDFRYSGGSYQLRIAVRKDDDTNTPGAVIPITDASHRVKLIWKAATGAGNNDGSLAIFIDGTFKQIISGVDNDTKVVDHTFWGAITGVDAGTSGSFFIDTIQWNDVPETFVPRTQFLLSLAGLAIPVAMGQIMVPTLAQATALLG